MPKFTFSIIASTLVAAIAALPQVQVYKDGGFAGDTANLPAGDPNGPNRGCQTLGDGWENSISSLKLDPNGLSCTFYATGDCTEGAGDWGFSGSNFAIPNDANDKFNSYRCMYGLTVEVTK